MGFHDRDQIPTHVLIIVPLFILLFCCTMICECVRRGAIANRVGYHGHGMPPGAMGMGMGGGYGYAQPMMIGTTPSMIATPSVYGGATMPMPSTVVTSYQQQPAQAAAPAASASPSTT